MGAGWQRFKTYLVRVGSILVAAFFWARVFMAETATQRWDRGLAACAIVGMLALGVWRRRR